MLLRCLGSLRTHLDVRLLCVEGRVVVIISEMSCFLSWWKRAILMGPSLFTRPSLGLCRECSHLNEKVCASD